MWGKESRKDDFFHDVGITPTHVGKSLIIRSILPTAEDHPHPCGEKRALAIQFVSVLGSPPPMWGKEKIWNT